MRMLRLVVPVMVASAVLASAASAASTQQAAKDRFAQDAQGARIVSAPATAAASTVTGTVSAKKLGVSSNATAGSVARAAVNRYAALLGVSNASSQLRYAQATTDALGQRHVRFDQIVGDVPVYDGAVTVHLARGDALTGFTAGVSRATSGAATQAVGHLRPGARRGPRPRSPTPSSCQAPKLYVYTGVPFGSHPATLAWAVDVTSKTRADRKLVFVDAVSGPGHRHARPHRVRQEPHDLQRQRQHDHGHASPAARATRRRATATSTAPTTGPARPTTTTPRTSGVTPTTAPAPSS